MPLQTRDPVETSRLRRVYSGYAASGRKGRAWDADNPGNRANLEQLCEHALAEIRPRIAAGADVLDIGCGSGWWLRRLLDDGVAPDRLHAVDLLDERLEAAHAAAPGAQLVAADARRLPYPDRSFGAVTLFTVLSSMPSRSDVRAALAEAARVVAPGGVVLVWEARIPTPNRATRRVRRRDVRDGLRMPVRFTTLTLVPPLARRLRGATSTLHPLLVRVPALRSHWLAVGEGRRGG